MSSAPSVFAGHSDFIAARAGYHPKAAPTGEPPGGELVVTHGPAHALAPTTRALTDDQLAAIADSEGVVGVSLGA